jgi:hypothetical protein
VGWSLAFVALALLAAAAVLKRLSGTPVTARGMRLDGGIPLGSAMSR